MYSVHVDEEGAPLPLMYTYTHVSSRLIQPFYGVCAKRKYCFRAGRTPKASLFMYKLNRSGPSNDAGLPEWAGRSTAL